MAPVSRTPLRPAAAAAEASPLDDDNIGDIFTALGQKPPGEEHPAEPKPGPTEEDRWAQYDTRMANLEARLAAEQQANNALMQSPVVVAPLAQQQDAWGALPDPITDPDKYASELTRRIESKVQNVTSAFQQQQTERQNMDQKIKTLWDTFTEQNPDYAADVEGIEFATMKVTREAQARGVDLNRYMFQNPERFYADVRAKYDAVFGDGEETDPLPEPVQPRRRGRKAAADTADNSRTGGIFGGSESGNRPGPQAPKPGDMIADIHALQRNSPYF